MIHEKHQAWLQARGLDPVLAEKLGLETVLRDGKNWLSVPYVERGQTVNHKYRKTFEKDHRMDIGAPLTLWNHDILTSPEVVDQGKAVVITEGEWDAIAAIQSGYPWTTSVPNGAQAIVDREENCRPPNLEYLDRCDAVLKGVSKFILAVDADRAGLALREELARRLGPYRCSFVEMPEDCKDFNEVLLAHGAAAVARIIASAKPYPVQGLYDFDDIPEPPPVEAIKVDIPVLKDHLFIVPGTLGVFTGWAGAGKTSLSMAIIASLIRQGISVTMGSFETQPKPILYNRLRAAVAKCSDWDVKHKDMTETDDLIRKHFSLIYQDVDDEQSFSLDDVLNLAATSVLRKGTRLLWLDPWNEMEHKRANGENETEYTGAALRKIKRFSNRFGVATWITAHPGKPDQKSFNSIPGLYSISGSANWANKADYGMSLTRKAEEGSTLVDVHLTKVRMGLPGKQGVVPLQFDFRTSEYLEVL